MKLACGHGSTECLKCEISEPYILHASIGESLLPFHALLFESLASGIEIIHRNANVAKALWLTVAIMITRHFQSDESHYSHSAFLENASRLSFHLHFAALLLCAMVPGQLQNAFAISYQM